MSKKVEYKDTGKRVYRYQDCLHPTEEGTAGVQIYLTERIIVRETEFYFYSAPINGAGTVTIWLGNTGYWRITKHKKNAERSSYHLTKHQAFDAYKRRKAHQVYKLKLQINRAIVAKNAVAKLSEIPDVFDAGQNNYLSSISYVEY